MNPGAATCFYTSPPSSKHLCAVVVSLFFSSFDHKDWETKETTAGGSHWLIPPFWRQLADGMFPATTLKSWSCDAEDLSFQMLIVPVTINSTALARGDRKYVNCTSVTQTDRFLTLKQHLQHCNLQVLVYCFFFMCVCVCVWESVLYVFYRYDSNFYMQIY